MSASIKLKELLSDHTVAAAPELVVRGHDGLVRCVACAHRCSLAPGQAGVCRVRFNQDGQLRVPGGYVAGVQIDPIEKKPFYHALPGKNALSIGMLGCNLHCSFCQNWVTSQVLRDENAVASPNFCAPQHLVDLAIEHDVPAIISTYNEPLITSDWAVEIFKRAKPLGLRCGYVSNGHATPEVLAFLRPWMSLYKVDLKSFSAENYRKLGANMSAILDSIAKLKEMDFWVEIVTLVVPGFNDSDEELRHIADFIAGVSVDIPWHVTAFRPEYKFTDRDRTPADTLARAYSAGKEAGIRHVYAGNLPGLVGNREHTYCHSCDECLIRRRGFHVQDNRLIDGVCPSCQTPIAGVWA